MWPYWKEGMTFQQLSIPPDQAQFLETRKFQIDEIARIFRVPPHMVGDLEKSTFSNIEQQSLEFVKYTLNPWCVRWEQAMNQQLVLAVGTLAGLYEV
jgi:HK97 family phage portal protein